MAKSIFSDKLNCYCNSDSNSLDLKQTKFYSINDIAEFLNVPRRSVYRWIVSGLLPGYKFMGTYRVTHEDLVLFLAQSKLNPPNHP